MRIHNYIERPELINLLNKGLDYPLMLSVAPAGSGKSVLLEQWRRHLTRQHGDSAVLYFALSQRHNEGDVLLVQLFEALKHITPLWEAHYFNLFKDDAHVSPDDFINTFAQALNQIDHTLVLIFDDFHLVTDQRLHTIFELLVRALPRHVTLVLSSRRHPLFSIARLKLEEAVFVIDSNDLRLNEHELNCLNASIGAPELTTSQACQLLLQTEGWFVGTKLAILAYDKGGTAALEHFSGTQPELLDYFGHEVLKRLAPALRNFVLATSIFNTFNQEVCKHVLGQDSSAALLDEVRMQELFLSSEPEGSQWFRYHPLLKAFLYRQLEIECGPTHIQRLHYDAARYFLDNGMLSAAIDHARQSHNSAFYFGMLEDICADWIKQGDLEPVVEQLENFSDQSFREHLPILIQQVSALCFTRRFNQAHYYLELLRSADAKKSDRHIASHIHFFERFLALFHNDKRIADRSLSTSSLHDTPADLVAAHEIIDAYILLCKGELDTAFRLASEASIRCQRQGHAFFDSLATPIVILCDRYLGRGLQAVQHMAEVFAPICDGKKTPLWINLATGMMVVEYEQNRLDYARDLGERLIPLVNHACATDPVVMVYMTMSRMLQLNGDVAKAQRMLDQLERILSLGDFQRFKSQVVQEKMRQAFCTANTVVCDQVYTRYHLETVYEKLKAHSKREYDEALERNVLALAYWLMSKSRFKQAHQLLDEMANILETQGIKTRALVARCTQLVIEKHMGNRDRALSNLKKLIERYGLVCFSRSVFDEAPGLAELFMYGVQQHLLALPELFTNTFQTLIDTTHHDLNTPPPALVLTDKEMEIFGLLAAGLSNTAISEQSGIALSTTKWHIKNIYLKLGVTRRSAAIRLAHQSVATKTA